MPSPLGHVIAGITAGLAVAPPARDRAALVRSLLLFGAAGAAADLDLIAGAHSGPTHGIGAAIAVGAIVLAVRLARAGVRPASAWRVAIAVALAYSTHTLLDWLGTDTSPPVGIMALWPLSDRYYESSVHVFSAISRRYWLGREFYAGNLRAIVRELAFLALPLLVVCWWRLTARNPKDRNTSSTASSMEE